MSSNYDDDDDYDEEQEEVYEDFESERQFFEKLDNTLQHKRSLVLKLLRGQENVGFTDMRSININLSMIKQKCSDYDNFLIVGKGINYHELAHIYYTKYTLRLVSEYLKSQNTDGSHARWNEIRGLFDLLGILEDSRIEILFSQRYHKSAAYFKGAVFTFLVNDAVVEQGNLSAAIGLYARRLWVGQHKIIEWANVLMDTKLGNDADAARKLINQYLTAMDAQSQISIAWEIQKLWKQHTPEQPSNPYPKHSEGGSSRKTTTKEEEETTEELKDALKDLKKQEKKQGKKQEESMNDGEGDGEEQGQAKKSKLTDELINAVKDAINQVKEQVKQQTKDDIEAQKDSMGKHGYGASDEESYGTYLTFYPSAAHRQIAQKMTKTILRLKSHLGNATVYNLKRGRVNMRAAMIQSVTQSDKIFKKFIPSKFNKTKLGVVVYLDSSGSMHESQFNTAIAASWTISKSLEQSGSMIKIYEYSSDCRVMKSLETATEKTIWKRNYAGGTSPESALQHSVKDFKQLEVKHGTRQKMAIIVTDGGFNDYKAVQNEIRKLKKLEVYTVLISINAYCNNHIDNPEQYNKILHIKNVSELHESIKGVIMAMQKKVIRAIA